MIEFEDQLIFNFDLNSVLKFYLKSHLKFDISSINSALEPEESTGEIDIFFHIASIENPIFTTYVERVEAKSFNPWVKTNSYFFFCRCSKRDRATE